MLRLSLDAKATVKIGPFSRGGKNRVETEACDHDFSSSPKLTPYGILLPELDELFIYCTTSKVTSDFIVDVLESWWESSRDRFAHIQTLVLNQDNGPENHSRRTQFMKRMVEFARFISTQSQTSLLSPLSRVNTIRLSEPGEFWKIIGMEIS